MASHKYIDKYVGASGKTVYIYEEPSNARARASAADRANKMSSLREASRWTSAQNRAKEQMREGLYDSTHKVGNDTRNAKYQYEKRLKQAGNAQRRRDEAMKPIYDVGTRRKGKGLSFTSLGNGEAHTDYGVNADIARRKETLDDLRRKSTTTSYAKAMEKRDAEQAAWYKKEYDKQLKKATARTKRAHAIQSIKSAGSRTLSSLKDMASGVRNLFGW